MHIFLWAVADLAQMPHLLSLRRDCEIVHKETLTRADVGPARLLLKVLRFGYWSQTALSPFGHFAFQGLAVHSERLFGRVPLSCRPDK